MDRQTNFYIVGIGASAGGFEALIDFFSCLPKKTNAAFVIVRHLLRDSPTFQEKILSKHTHMEVLRAENGQRVCPNHVYMLPENYTLTIREGRLYLQLRNEDKINRAVDIFFSSLALDQKHRAIGIILSGLGSDGVDGANALHAEGGMVMVQQPESAQFSGMPETAIAGDDPDAILPPGKLAQMLMTHLKIAPAVASSEG
jgi:two-component system CheB/CheR fusion protein